MSCMNKYTPMLRNVAKGVQNKNHCVGDIDFLEIVGPT